MSNYFYILPDRKVAIGGLGSLLTGVTSIDSLRGDISITADNTTGIVLGVSGQTIELSIEPDFYVLRAGDTITGNLQFAPTGGAYGLALYSAASDPAQHTTGALYFNTTNGELKIYSGGSWVSLTNPNYITTTTADSTYLRLDATNGPMQGNLSMGSATFHFGNKSTDPVSGSLGDIYYNTTNNVLRLYTVSGWTSIASAVTSIVVGAGLTPTGTITSTGSIAVDQGYNFNWTGNNQFSNAITFAMSQTFALSGLTTSGLTKGDLIYYNGSNFARFAITSTIGEVLTVVSDGLGGFVPQWNVPSGGELGNPSSGAYSDGLLSFTSTTLVADAIVAINDTLLALAPVKASLLTSNNLGGITSGSTVKLPIYPSGAINNAWYADGASAGSTISGYVTFGVYPTLNTLSLSSGGFRTGSANTPSSYGQLQHKVYNYSNPSGSVVDSIDLTVHYTTVYASGTLSLTSIGVYNSLWEQSDATIVYTQTSEGYEGHTLYHTEAGESNKAKYYFDSYSASNPNPVFAVSPTAAENSGNVYTKYLSGIQYYTLNSQFKVAFSASSGIYNRAYHATHVATISQTGMVTQNYNPGSTPTYTDSFDCTGTNAVIAILNSSNASTMSKYLTVTLYKANGNTVSAQASINYPICTYGTVSTTTSDLFFDEAQRLPLGTSLTNWNSSSALVNGNAQVRNGTLQYANSTDYPSFSGNQEYQRFIYKTSSSTGNLVLSNLQYTNISPYGSGDINVLLQLDNDNVYFDLGVSAGTPLNGSSQPRDGSSRSQAFGGRNSGSLSTSINYTLGTYTTGPTGSGNLGRFRLIVIFNTNVQSITAISSS